MGAPDRDAWTTYATREGLIREDPAPGPLANKYHALPVHVDGIRLASKKEAARYLELRLREKAGLIAELELHPVFPLHILELWRSGLPVTITTVGKYTADFRYCDLQTGEIVVEDTKAEATRTEAYRLRKKLAEAIHGITITEV
jgi:hypothetical protein